MDNIFRQTLAGRQQSRSYNDGTNTVFPSGGPHYSGPRYQSPSPPAQGSETQPGMFSNNVPGQNPGLFWPSQGQPEPSSSHQWTTPPPSQSSFSGYGGQPYIFPPRLPPLAPGPESFSSPRLAHGYGFDPSIPPPPFNCPIPSSQFSPTMTPDPRILNQDPLKQDPVTQGGPLNPWVGDGHNNIRAPNNQRFGQHTTANVTSGSQSRQYGYQPNSEPDIGRRPQHSKSDFTENHGRPLLSQPPFPLQGKVSDHSLSKTRDLQPLDEESSKRAQDEKWVERFLQNRGKGSQKTPELSNPTKHSDVSVRHIRDTLYGAVRLVSKLSLACETLKHNLENESVWVDSFTVALSIKKELQEKLKVVSDPECVDSLKKKLTCIAKKRARQRRRKLAQMEDERVEEERIAEKEAAIEKWRMKRIQEVEEKKREHELKLEADSVLSEVMKKQGDVKRMLEILRSLEKLRKLRKEAASRKGIFPEQDADVAFDRQLEQLRALIRKRTAIYSVEENALRVMLEGEREEERKRDLEKRQKKERDRQLQRKREMEAMLFGEELPVGHPLQPFTQYYTQAERSLPALIQIRREWDVFLVPEDHPDGTAVPRGWVLPEPPTDLAWASALDTSI